ncbi:hypothetical protein DPMN_193400 [Dreissena polymorpha]|uniref:Uncharacterized protein n=1 Tax=Dreissena polymorpha TaxID=45954 RepID=A0A9D3Y6W0_DREPO|nr:hypothetical protein DPMN_193400 [Dreissena polymorpha]
MGSKHPPRYIGFSVITERFILELQCIVKTVKSKTDLKNNSPSVSNQEGTATCRECADRRFKFQDLRNFQL